MLILCITHAIWRRAVGVLAVVLRGMRDDRNRSQARRFPGITARRRTRWGCAPICTVNLWRQWSQTKLLPNRGHRSATWTKPSAVTCAGLGRSKQPTTQATCSGSTTISFPQSERPATRRIEIGHTSALFWLAADYSDASPLSRPPPMNRVVNASTKSRMLFPLRPPATDSKFQ
jgi:hypothetical protein